MPSLEADPERLCQALLHLLVHAQQQSPDAPLRLDGGVDAGVLWLRISCGAAASGDVVGGESPELSAAYEIVAEHAGTVETGGAGEHEDVFVVRLPAVG